MAAEGNVDVVIQLKKVAEFVGGLKEASQGVDEFGKKTEDAGKRAAIGWKGVVKWTGTATAMYGATKFLKDSVTLTTDMARSTITLARATGMETQAAGEWAAVTKARGIETKDFQKAIVKLSTQMEKAKSVTGKSAAELKKMGDVATSTGGASAKAMEAIGVSAQELKEGDIESVLMKTADAMMNMESASQRNALAMQLFGRQGQALIPILMKGEEGVKELMAEQEKLGNVVGEDTVESTKDLIATQRELKASWQGLRIQMGELMIPILNALVSVMNKLMNVFQPIIKNSKALQVVIISILTLFVAWKAATIAMAVAQLIAAGTTALWGLAILAIIILIGLLVAGLIWAYKNVDWFAAAVDYAWKLIKTGADWLWKALTVIWEGIWAVLKWVWDLIVSMAKGIVGAWETIVDGLNWMWEKIKAVWNWIKDNWPLLLAILTGPFGIAVYTIVKHFDKIKAAAQAAVDFIKRVFNNLVEWFKTLPSRIGDTLKDIPGVSQAVEAGQWVGKTAQKVIPGGAAGGIVNAAGAMLVGERGPEVVVLPRAASVNPLPLPQAAPASVGAPMEVTVPVVIEGREVARAVARVSSDKAARR